MFHHRAEELQNLCAQVLDLAKQQGATAAEADVSESNGQSVQVRLQEIEQIEYQQDKSLDITVYVGQAKGRASTADFSPQALQDTVTAAANIARYTAQDEYAGLADAVLMATDLGDADAYHPWALPVTEAVDLARQCEAAAQAADTRIQNSEGASVQTGHYQYVYGNSHGFLAHQQGSRHSISCSVVAADKSGMQRDYWYDLARSAADLDSAEAIGQTAAKRTVRRLNAQSVPTGVYPVLFDATVSGSLIGHLVGALSGGAHNLHLDATCATQADLLRQMGSGLLVTELMGQGVNTITGDYSRGAAGFWVENGVIAYPVEEITIASRLQDMFMGMVGAADDALKRSAHKVGSVLIEQMTVAGQ